MDWGRRPYTTIVRPYRNSEITAKIVWRPAAPGAKPYPHLHAFQSRDWCDDFFALTGVGEVPFTPRTYNAASPIPGLVGDKPCGLPAWFEFGQPLTAVGTCPLDDNRIPLCCGHKLIRTGAVISGTTSHGAGPLPPPPPPAMTGGAISGVTTAIPPNPPGCVAPGSSAGTTTPAPLNQWCNIEFAPVQETWWYWAVIPGTRYRLEVVDQTCPTGTWYVYTATGGVIDGILATGPGISWPINYHFNAPGDGVYFRFVSDCGISKFARIGLWDDPTGETCFGAQFIGLNNTPPYVYGPGAPFWWQVGTLNEGETFWAERFYEAPSSGQPAIYIGDDCANLEFFPLEYPDPACPYQGQFTMPRSCGVWVLTNTDQSISVDRFWRIVPGPVVCNP